MLVRTPFLSAAELHLCQEEYDALVKVLIGLERGDFVHDKFLKKDKPNGFNMDVVGEKTECGTTCCIYGWALIFNPSFRDIWNIPDNLYNLFLPTSKETKDIRYREITLEQTSSALRNFLTFGKASWKEIFQ